MLEITAVPQRALAVYAHPDDPEVSAGGTIARWAAAGCEVHVVVTTLSVRVTPKSGFKLQACSVARGPNGAWRS